MYDDTGQHYSGPVRIPRRRWLYLAWACAAVVLAGAVVAMSVFTRKSTGFEPEVALDFRDRVPVSGPDGNVTAANTSVIRVAVAPVISPETSTEMYREFVIYLADKLGRRVVFMRGESYSEVNDLIRMHQCDVALVCTYSYVLAEKEFGAQLLAIPEIDGKTVYHSLIVVPTSSKASSLLDLRDRRFASCDVLSNSGWLYPMVWLKSRGHNEARFFGKHIISGSHDRSVYAVRSGVVDGAAVDSIVYEQMIAQDPELRTRVKVIHRSPPFGMPPLIVPADLSPGLLAELRQILLDMHTDHRGKAILESLGFDRFVTAKNHAYDSVRKLHETWQSKP